MNVGLLSVALVCCSFAAAAFGQPAPSLHIALPAAKLEPVKYER